MNRFRSIVGRFLRTQTRDGRDGPVGPRFLRATSGVASVEFALLGSVLLAMFAGFLDITYMMRARMYSDRTSMLMAHSIAACKGDTKCLNLTMQQLMAVKANILLRFTTAEIGMVVFQKTNGAIKVCFGPTTYLEDDIMTSAQNILQNDDTGVAVYVKTTYKSFFPNYVVNYLSSTGATYRDYTIDVTAHDNPCV